jgi:hypothetical protein
MMQVDEVKGRLVRDPATRAVLTGRSAVPVTPYYMRRVRCGDLELVEVEARPEPTSKPEDRKAKK